MGDMIADAEETDLMTIMTVEIEEVVVKYLIYNRSSIEISVEL